MRSDDMYKSEDTIIMFCIMIILGLTGLTLNIGNLIITGCKLILVYIALDRLKKE